ncbi:hypothetical protein C8Q76DRAFT_637387 [Earliella scabrosa]|nr:hypothetical protein C8Q76DRAFT_637387 [Earliella scabrosa]
MVHFVATLLLVLSATAQAAPLKKRIAQVISDSTASWEKSCLAAGGGERCNPVSVTAFTTLLAAAGPCEQQDAADAMIDLANTLNSDADMIKFAQIFAQQPRNTPNSLAVPYCQKAPKNSELKGLFQCQFEGASQKTFVGGLALGAAGTIPFGHPQPLSPLGSCAAHPDGPIADGTQLTDITQNPGLDNISPGSNESSDDDEKSSSSVAAPSSTEAASSRSAAEPTRTQASATSPSPPSPSSTAAPSSDFKLQNALDAQKLNAQFKTLSKDSSCADDDQACIEGGFAMCVGGKFVNMGCAATTQCFALPLVNKPGTSLACTTESDALARIAAPGATGGLTGSD